MTQTNQEIKQTLQRQLTAYRRLNQWETAERSRTLPQLTIAESVKQYLAMSAWANTPAHPDLQTLAYWQQRAQVMRTCLERWEEAKI
jgi:hypothetical protein